MITLERPAYFTSERYAEYYGLSTDDKQTIQAHNADEFYEIDTGKTYKYNQTGEIWVEQPSRTTAVDTGLPPITDEVSGHFLSNDGSVTHWQTLASKNFIIQLTEQVGNGTYTADKTYVEIKAAYDNGQNIVVRLDNSEFSLMNAEFANDNEAGFTFGYTEVRLEGQVVQTRSIQYSHSNGTDSWTDSDKTADLSSYLPLTGGTINGRLYLTENPIEDLEASTKYYVDNHNLIVRLTQDQTAGFNADKSIQEIVAASLAKKYISAELNGDVYCLTSISATEAIFTHVDGNKVSTLSYLDGAWSKSEQSLLPTKGGKMDGNIDMGANAITNVQKIHVDGSAPIYIGSVVESGETNAARLTGVAGGGAAFVKANTQREYATVAVGRPTQTDHAINMGYLLQDVIADQPTQDHQIANKEYVDNCTSKCVKAVESPNGVLKAYLQNGAKQDVCVVSDAGLASSIARYTSKGHLIDQGTPTENNHLTNKRYVDEKLSNYNNTSGDFQIGGNLTVGGTASVIGTPTQGVDIPNKNYVDTQIQQSVSDVVRKQSVAIGSSSSVNISLSNGVYLITISDNYHGGLVCVQVYPDGETISGIVNINGWKCDKLTGSSGVILTNESPNATTAYITSIGEGTYR